MNNMKILILKKKKKDWVKENTVLSDDRVLKDNTIMGGGA